MERARVIAPAAPVREDVPVRVFVVNCGSSSLKYRLVDTAGGEAIAGGLIERVTDHAAAPATACEQIAGERIECVGHRVVHGGARFSAPVVVDDEILDALRELAVLAPLHNPVNVLGIEVARRALPELEHVAVF